MISNLDGSFGARFLGGRQTYFHYGPNDEGRLAFNRFFDLRTVKEPRSKTLPRLAELVLINSQLLFIPGQLLETNQWCGREYQNGTQLRQSSFQGYIEHQFLNQYNGSKPELYGRYIHDCICATPSTREEINHFITAVNSLYPSLKYTCEISGTSFNSLSGYHSFYRKQRLMHQCALQTNRFSLFYNDKNYNNKNYNNENYNKN